MQYNLSSKSIGLLNDITSGINSLLNQLSAKLSKNTDESGAKTVDLSSCLDDLTSLIMEEFDSDDSNLRLYAQFLSKVSLLAYFQQFDNDKDMSALKERHEVSEGVDDLGAEDFLDDLVQEGEEIRQKLEKKYDVDTDFKFGFDGLYDLVCSAVEVIQNRELSNTTVEQSVNANLLTNIREVDVESYLNDGYMNKDVQLIAILGDEPPVNIAEEIMSFIESDNNSNSIYESAVQSILGIYKYLLQDSFGLRPYVGVLSFNNPYIDTITPSYRLGTVRDAETVFQYISGKLKNYYKVKESPKRQFDIKSIVYNEGVIQYFPKKLLEYAMGRELTYKLSESVYRPYKNANSWEVYEEGYVEPQVRRLVHEAIYFSLEKNFDFSAVGVNTNEFVSEEFSKVWKEKESLIKSMLSSGELKVYLDKDISRVISSMCSGVVVTSYNSLGSKVNSITLRVVDIDDNLSTDLTSTLFSSFSTNTKIKYSAGEVISEGKMLGDGSNPLPFRIIEYRHDFDSKLSDAEPLFGYTAVELFRDRGVPISWERILLGEDIKGTPLFASLTSQDDLPMQAYTIHNMMAGSRAGKGVQTMNIIASAIANDMPVFYLDRKPDMAVMFYQLTGGNMFVVNGGQYIAKNDPHGDWSDSGSAVSGWRNAYASMPSYLKDKLFTTETYSGSFGDFVYFRGVMLMMSILMARVELGGTEYYNALGGSDGLVIVIDEFKNWQKNFENSWFAPTGNFGNKNRLDKTSIAKYRKLQADIKKIKAQLATGVSDDKRAKLELDMQLKEEEIAEVITPERIYCTEVMNKYGDTIKNVAEALAAGFKDNEGRVSNIFVIGQDIDIDGYDGSANKSGTYEERDSGLFNVNVNTKGKSLMRGLFNMFASDWFMGRNVDKPNYMGASNEGSRANKWLNDKAYWGYCRDVSMESLRTSEPSNVKYFKPYLVLNNNLEDDPKSPAMITVGSETVPNPDFTFVSQCRARVNDAVPGANLWEKIRLKHLNKPKDVPIDEINSAYGNLHEGIGFKGLANLTKQSNGKGEFNPTVDMQSSVDIANFVAQKMGYSNYKELLYDFSPQGIFSSKDVIKAIRDPQSFQDLNKRLPLFAKYGFFGSDAQEESEARYSGDEEFKDEFMEEGGTDFDDYEQFDDEPIKTPAGEQNTDVWDGFGEEEVPIDEEDEVLTEAEIRNVCEKVLKSKAEQYSVELTPMETVQFIDGVLEKLKTRLQGGF